MQYHLSWEQQQLLKRMTLQVCLIGKDGFVLASDTRILKILPGEITQRFSTTKIFCNQMLRAAWCSAGDDLARQFCEQLEHHLSEIKEEALPLSNSELGGYFQSAADSVRNRCSHEEQMWGKGKALFACSGDDGSRAWCLHLSFLQTPQRWDLYRVVPLSDKLVIGAEGNASIFIAERYYRADATLDELLRIASHTVLMGGKIDPYAVNGLEVVVARNGQLLKLTESELKLLRGESQRLDEDIARQFGASD
jgi:hypothetical protein